MKHYCITLFLLVLCWVPRDLCSSTHHANTPEAVFVLNNCSKKLKKQTNGSFKNPLKVIFIICAAGVVGLQIAKMLKSYNAVKNEGIAFSTTSAVACSSMVGLLSGALTYTVLHTMKNKEDDELCDDESAPFSWGFFFVSCGSGIMIGTCSYLFFKQFINVTDDNKDNELFRVVGRTGQTVHGLASFVKALE